MFDIITTICDLVIAFVGLCFAYLEVRKSMKDKKKEEYEIKMCAKLVQQASESVKISEVIEKSIYEISNSQSKVDEDDYEAIIGLLNVSKNEIQTILEKEQLFIDNITALYKNLLQNESMFSLSIGFERFIIACRPVIYELPEILEEMKHLTHMTRTITSNLSVYQCLDIMDRDGGMMKTTIFDNFENFKKLVSLLEESEKILENTQIAIKELELKFEQ